MCLWGSVCVLVCVRGCGSVFVCLCFMVRAHAYVCKDVKGIDLPYAVAVTLSLCEMCILS